jgi:hypothetical protein
MRTQLLALALAAGAFAGIASAEVVKPRPAPEIKNTFAFDVMKPAKKCKQVTGSLLKKLAKYTCAPLQDVGTASGKPAVAECVAKKGSSTFLLFAAAADCEEERETQRANGP